MFLRGSVVTLPCSWKQTPSLRLPKSRVKTKVPSFARCITMAKWSVTAMLSCIWPLLVQNFESFTWRCTFLRMLNNTLNVLLTFWHVQRTELQFCQNQKVVVVFLCHSNTALSRGNVIEPWFRIYSHVQLGLQQHFKIWHDKVPAVPCKEKTRVQWVLW